MNTVMENSLDCSSGCESGWTMYFENSSVSTYESRKRNGILDCEERKLSKETDDDKDEEEEEEEDLSLISDASSGPPHYLEEVYMNSNNYHAPPVDAGLRKKSGKIKKTKENHCKCRKVPDQHTLLDDTASSAVFNFSNNNFTYSNNYASAENFLEISEGYSATHFEVRTGYYQYQGQYDSCHSSISGKFLQQNQLFQEKRWQ